MTKSVYGWNPCPIVCPRKTNFKCKNHIYEKIYRILKVGGRMAVSDMALRVPLPPQVMSMAQALVGCVAGAELIEDNIRWAASAGLENIEVKEKSGYIEGMVKWDNPLYRSIIDALPEGKKLADYILSIQITACKKALASCVPIL